MVEVQRTFVVNQPVEVVRPYLTDFAHAEQWEPGTRSCTQTSDGEVAQGTTWRNVADFMGREVELDYRLALVEDGHLSFVGENKQATSINDIFLMTEGDARTVINYKATIEFHGLAKLAAPVAQREFEKIADDTAAQMADALNALSA